MTISDSYEQAAAELIRVGRRLWQQGFCPATSSNFSRRLDAGQCAITVSGRDKGLLQHTDIMRIDMNGLSLDGQTPSAETLLHTQLYRRDTSIGAVLHTHSVKAALVSMHVTGSVMIEGLELLKALKGIKTHQSTLEIPVFDNTQDIVALAQDVDRWMTQHGTGHAYLIKGHGLYSWGANISEALRHIEALEYLLDYYWHQNELRLNFLPTNTERRG
ncbi:methylthioribulose 1-phosphate dehydratase [Gammaproteobacteria bacterium LSUCC0112]|nr:methylthioribulose 1-phosphate dehydratase [Gammaproteobacteria bacterium LSUCC0112]